MRMQKFKSVIAPQSTPYPPIRIECDPIVIKTVVYVFPFIAFTYFLRSFLSRLANCVAALI